MRDGRSLTGRFESPTEACSHRGLDGFAFFLADVQVGFGPFLAIYLTSAKWTHSDIGIVLTAGSILGLVSQIPGGSLVDALRSDKLAANASVLAIALSALWVAMSPEFLSVVLANMLHVGASAVAGPALAAMSLGLAGYDFIGERIGRNARFSSCGSIAAAIAMGLVGQFVSPRAVFFVTASFAIPAMVALQFISAQDIKRGHRTDAVPAQYDPFKAFKDIAFRVPIIILSICVFFFHLANAAVLPLVASTFTMRLGERAAVLIAIAMIIPQIIVAVASPYVGRLANAVGRRRLLQLGFGALVIRTVLLASTTDPAAILIIQIFDGVSATILGVLIPTCVADVVSGSGNFNLALGFVSSAMGIGAAMSTTLAGVSADHMGSSIALLILSAFALTGSLVLILFMPETRVDSSGR